MALSMLRWRDPEAHHPKRQDICQCVRHHARAGRCRAEQPQFCRVLTLCRVEHERFQSRHNLQRKIVSARRGCTDELRESQTQVPTSIVREHRCALLQHTSMVWVRTTVLSNHKMEASRLLQCNSVCILMFVAQLMWLDMRAKVKTEHLRRAQFSAHMSLNTMFAARTCSRARLHL